MRERNCERRRERPPLWWEGRKKDESILWGNPKDALLGYLILRYL